MNDEPTPPTEEPAASTTDGGEAAETLDDTQRIEVPRYAPAPDPRPDARWAWAPPSGQPSANPSPGGWQEPAPTEPSGAAGAAGAYPGGDQQPAWTSGTGWSHEPTPTQAPDWSRPAGTGGATPPPSMWQQPPTPLQPHKRRAGLGLIVGASLLSAVLASGATVLVLGETGALDRTVVTTVPPGTSQSISNTPVTIDESSAVITAAAKVSPAVVKITTEGQSGDPFSGTSPEGVGSGLIYDANGWILTNRHVISGANQMTVELKDGRQFDGHLYGIDTLTDLAIVKIDATNLPSAPIGSSDGLKVGQLVIAIGSPLGTYSFSVTSGIVSGKGRDVQLDTGDHINNLIQTDAAINPGNSGGPLVDANGDVVGINTAVATSATGSGFANGIGFAIPIDIARPIMDQAIKGETLARPWIGIRFFSINLQLQKDQSLPVANGALVTSSGGTDPAVVPNSPADQAGIQEGDIITAINGINVDTEHPLDALLVQFSPGDTVVLDVLRDGSTIQVSVTLGTRPVGLS